MSDINIFVSHRIDVTSALPNCTLYLPVRCGAVLDEFNTSDIQGDDTGDNISEKRAAYGEFTVQYWAWKNTVSEYIGLCHYRRYFSFSEKHFRAKKYDKMIHVPVLCPHVLNKFNIEDTDRIVKTVEKTDIIIPEPIKVTQLPTINGIKDTVGEMWNAYTEFSCNGKSFSEFILYFINEISPKYSASAVDYLRGNIHHGFNCYIMKYRFFNEMCEFQFPIMAKFEEYCKQNRYEYTGRLIGYFGEALNGIFIHYLINELKVNYKELQLVFFNDTQKNTITIKQYIRFYAEQLLDSTVSIFFPRGSVRRKKLKKIFKE